MEITNRLTQRRPQQAASRQVVEWAEAYVRAHIGNPLPLSRLCRIVGRSERGLRDAFYRVHGVSPKQWMLAERLAAARRALREAQRPTATVTAVATDYGFFELGRFAASYREAFGEAPSATLRATSRNNAVVEHERTR